MKKKAFEISYYTSIAFAGITTIVLLIVMVTSMMGTYYSIREPYNTPLLCLLAGLLVGTVISILITKCIRHALNNEYEMYDESTGEQIK